MAACAPHSCRRRGGAPAPGGRRRAAAGPDPDRGADGRPGRARPGPGRPAVPGQRRQGLPRRAPAGHARPLQRRPSSAAFLANGTTVPHCCDQLGDVPRPDVRHAGRSRGREPSYFKDSSFGVPDGRGGADLLPARGRHDRARPRVRRPARVRAQPRRRDVRARLRGRRGPAVLHGRAAPRRPRASCRASRAAPTPAMDAEQWEVAPYTEADLSRQATPAGRTSSARTGASSSATSRTTSPASTPYIAEAKLNPTMLPGRVRRDQPAAGTGPVEAGGPDRHRLAGGRHLRQGRRRGAGLDAGGRRAPAALRPQARAEGVPQLPLGRGPRGAGDGHDGKRFPYQKTPQAPARASRGRTAGRCSRTRSRSRAPAGRRAAPRERARPLAREPADLGLQRGAGLGAALGRPGIRCSWPARRSATSTRRS